MPDGKRLTEGYVPPKQAAQPKKVEKGFVPPPAPKKPATPSGSK